MKLFLLSIAILYAAISTVISVKKLPVGIPQHQYCLGCIATVKELEKKISKRHLTAGNREVKIIEMMEKICSPPNFVMYEYSPPKTVRACEKLLENHEEELESALVKAEENVEQLICYEASGACEGVDLNDKKSKYADVDLTAKDGEKIVTRSMKIDPETNKAVPEKEEKKEAKNEGRTISKKSKTRKKDKKKSKDTKSKKPSGQQKGALHNLNVDINDPTAMKKVLDQIKVLTNDMKKPEGKDTKKPEEKDEL